MNVKQLTDVVALQAEEIRALREELEALRAGVRAWASVAQARIRALEAKPVKKASDWVSGPRPSRPVRRPQAPAAAAAEPEPAPAPLDDPVHNPSPITDADCPF